ncbi:conjugal transfer protein TraG [Pedobacter ginsengisoli]|uniref:Conjugal transfer protein TraG n=1 Tax=Pedobacter ginsengisoli TaxID=363852 RepID=A0A2D1U783_9SPHI|nr:TraG family conjugative transposon ATPase [Pedobacter ginsengisoli]ATP57414.1 conjugal transfer protein TraG [Pedobacter ginsengisoli]
MNTKTPNLFDVLPIMGIENDCIISSQGDLTVVFQVELPEIFSLSDAEYESFHQSWVKAIKVLPQYSLMHKQDWFLQCAHQAQENLPGFLAESSAGHFQGRPFLQHECYLMLCKKPSGRKTSSSLFCNLLKKTIVPSEFLKPTAFDAFLGQVSQFKRILEDCGLIKLKRLKTPELESYRRKSGLIERYCSLSENPEEFLYKDISFDDSIQIGDQFALLYTLGDAADLPQVCGPRITYDKFSTDKTRFPIGFAGSLGLLLSCNHIYNQYLFIDDPQASLKKIESKRLRLQSLSGYSRENTIARDASNDFLNEAIIQQRLPLKAHFNILVWTNRKAELAELRNKVCAALAQMDAAAKPELIGAAQIWWAGIPGNAADFPMNETLDIFAEQACCFLNLESNYRSVKANQGIRFCDRLSGRPIYIDLFDEPRTSGIASNMGVLVCGSSGGGKSMTINHILSTLYQQGAHCVTVDIGGSYKGLCELVGGYYFTYTEDEPIRFNPFYLPEGNGLDTEKKESLKALLISLWKQEHDPFNRSEYVALSNALQGYYDELKKDQEIFPCFNTFYDFLQNKYAGLLQQHKVKDKDFDLDNFLYVLRPYYQGGEFDYLLNARGNLDLLQQPFIVIELDNIKDHPILFPVVTLIVMELFISKIRKLPGVRKILTIDEAWKAIAKSGMAEFLKYAFKTIRKFNGIPIVITQELDDLISSPVIKDAIINNADIKILMDMRKFLHKFDKLQSALGLSDKSKTILLSVNKDNREIFIEIGGQRAKVYKNELCPEEYYAYTTEGRERVLVSTSAEKHGSMEAGITALIKDKNNN